MSENSEKLPEIEQKMRDLAEKADEKNLTFLTCYLNGNELNVIFGGKSRTLGALCTKIFRYVATTVAAKDPQEYEHFADGILMMVVDQEAEHEL